MGRPRRRRKPAITVVVGLVALVLSTQFVPSACAGAGAPLWLPAAPSTRK